MQHFSAFDDVSEVPVRDQLQPLQSRQKGPLKDPVCGIAALILAQLSPSVRNYRTLFGTSVKIIAPLSNFYPSIPYFKYTH